jgi:hypothetical protein
MTNNSYFGTERKIIGGLIRMAARADLILKRIRKRINRIGDRSEGRGIVIVPPSSDSSEELEPPTATELSGGNAARRFSIRTEGAFRTG